MPLQMMACERWGLGAGAFLVRTAVRDMLAGECADLEDGNDDKGQGNRGVRRVLRAFYTLSPAPEADVAGARVVLLT